LGSEQMSDHIELHDSQMAVRLAGSAVVLELRPAYVHHWDRSSEGWRGEGRTQAADIVITNGTVASSPGGALFEVSDGWFEIGGQLHNNMVRCRSIKPAPFAPASSS
jgi:hypothetical protein